MIGRYRIVRGKRPPDDPLPDGVRVDVRKHVAHALSPEPAMVEALAARARARPMCTSVARLPD